MKPTQQLLALAKQKASGLQPATQIRLTADELSYMLFADKDGTKYIGVMAGDQLVKFFANKPVYAMVAADNRLIANIQKL